MSPGGQSRGLGTRLLRRAIRRRRALAATGVVAAIFYQGAFLVIPVVTGRAVDEVVLGGQRDRLPGYVAVLVGVAFVRAVAGAFRKYVSGRFGATLGADLRGDLYQHFQRMSFSFHDRLGSGQLMSRAASDITAIERVVMMIPFAIQAMLLGIGGAVLLIVLDPLLGALVVVTIALASIRPVQHARPIRESSHAFQDLLGQVADYFEQQIHGIEVVKGYGFERLHAAQGRTLVQRLQRAGIELTDRRAKFLTLFGLAPSLAVVAVVGVGVAHRLETLTLASRVVLLDAGRVVADGTHDDLLALPLYREALALDGPDDAAPPQPGTSASRRRSAPS